MRRRLAREVALTALFQVDTGAQPLERALAFAVQLGGDEAVSAFAQELAEGVLASLGRLDAAIAGHAAGWSVGRMPVVDRNILRLACYEILCMADQPAAVAISEAVELAKKYGSAESPRFINGVLGSIARQAGAVEVSQP